MSGINKVILIGSLGDAPEVKYAASGSAICSFSIATSESWVDKTSGEKKELTEWHNISVFGKLAEVCGEFLSKGKKAYIEGKLKTDKYTDKAGVVKYTTKIIADKIEFLSPREDKPASAPAARPTQRANPKPSQAQDDFDDSIPFN
jgi:single-strand DNA-binding protein